MHRIMKRVLVLGLFACFSLGTMAAQEQRQFARVYCVKAADGAIADLRQAAHDLIKKVSQARVGTGNLVSWAFWESVIPGGQRAECDFVAIYSFDGFPKQVMPLAEAIKKAKLDMTESEFLDKRSSLSRLVKNELWVTVAAVGETQPGNFVRFNFMKVHDMEEWLDLERNVWQRIMEVRVEEGKLQAWGSHQLVMPGGTSQPYDAGTADVFSDWDAIGKPQEMDEMLKKAHPGKEWRDITDRGQAARDIVRSGLWKVLEVVSASDR